MLFFSGGLFSRLEDKVVLPFFCLFCFFFRLLKDLFVFVVFVVFVLYAKPFFCQNVSMVFV